MNNGFSIHHRSHPPVRISHALPPDLDHDFSLRRSFFSSIQVYECARAPVYEVRVGAFSLKSRWIPRRYQVSAFLCAYRIKGIRMIKHCIGILKISSTRIKFILCLMARLPGQLWHTSIDDKLVCARRLSSKPTNGHTHTQSKWEQCKQTSRANWKVKARRQREHDWRERERER